MPEIVKQYGGEHFLPIQERLWVQEIFRRLVEVTKRKDLEYTLTVLDSAEANAFALPGGYIFITRGLLGVIGSDEAKLAAVLAHEIAHSEKKHGLSAVFRQMGLTVLMEVGVMAFDFASADLMRMATATLVQLLQLGWGREAEYEADAIGQIMAVQAGFDGVGAVSLLDDLFVLDSDDLPMKLFRTHPDTKNRRDRLEASLVSFWSVPALVTDQQTLEKLNLGRNYDHDGRNDPNGRYVVSIPTQNEQSGLDVFDHQLGQPLTWLESTKVQYFAWSPQGKYLAVVVEDHSKGQLWICDRYGHAIRKATFPNHHGEIKGISWSPPGQRGHMLALDINSPEGGQVLVTYLEADVLIPVHGELSGNSSIWMDEGLYFLHNGQWYFTRAPEVLPVVPPNPVPRVLQRKRILSPTVIKEGDTIRLTRPALTLP